MAEAPRDQNHIPTLLAVSSVDGVTPVVVYADPVTHRLLTDNAGGGSGTVTDVSVVSANGFAGTVANSTTTPAITISTTITGIIKGNGTAISAATAGTDYTALAFKTISVATQSDIVADSAADTLTLVAGTNITITTDATTDTITITGAGASGFATVALDNLASVAINAALVLGTSDAFALGSTTKQWADLFLAEGGVINWDNGDATITQTNNVIAVAGITDLTVSGNITPAANDGGALGSATVSFSDLFLASGAVINIANGNWVATHTSAILTVGTGDLRVTTAGTNSASVVTVGGAQTLTSKTLTSAALNTCTVGTSLVPTSDDGAALGDVTHNFSDLFLASGAVINYANGNVVVTHTSGILTIGTGTLKITTPTNTSTSVVTIDGTQTFTNKTMTSSTNVLGGVTMTLGSDADGDTYYRSSNVLTRLAKGTSGAILQQGVTNPGWTSWTMATPGTSGNVLTSDGTNWTSAAAAGGGTERWVVSQLFEATGRSTILNNGLGTTTFGTAGLVQTTGATANGYTRMRHDLGGSFTQAKNPSMTNSGYVNTAPTTGDWFWGYGSPTIAGSGITFTDAHVGFKIIYSGSTATLSATNSGGAAETATTITASVGGSTNIYYWRYTGSTNVKYYLNGTLQATHTTNINAGDNDWTLVSMITNDATNTTYINAVQWMTIQQDNF